MRHRIEDLGRVSVLVNLILNKKMLRIKEDLHLSLEQYTDWFFSQDKEAQEALVMEVGDIQDRLFEILSIADGIDPLNGGAWIYQNPPETFID